MGGGASCLLERRAGPPARGIRSEGLLLRLCLSTSRVAFAALGPPVADSYGSVLRGRLRARRLTQENEGAPGAVLQRGGGGDGGETDLLVRRRLAGLG